ncbi:hypothetical protein PCANC_10945, partial [Puccinia coronata f. sp. avenae]
MVGGQKNFLFSWPAGCRRLASPWVTWFRLRLVYLPVPLPGTAPTTRCAPQAPPGATTLWTYAPSPLRPSGNNATH